MLVVTGFLGAFLGTFLLVTLPEVPLPEAAGSLRLGGPVTLEGVLAALWQGLQLAAMLAARGVGVATWSVLADGTPAPDDAGLVAAAAALLGSR